MTEQLKDYQRIEVETWEEKAENCPLKGEITFCCDAFPGYKHCEFKNCAFRYWLAQA
jgi:hypothetical protein